MNTWQRLPAYSGVRLRTDAAREKPSKRGFSGQFLKPGLFRVDGFRVIQRTHRALLMAEGCISWPTSPFWPLLR